LSNDVLEELMIESWFQDYVFLAFRIEKALRAHAAQSPFIDYYYGPPTWKTVIDNEPISPPSRLVRDVDMLANALALQSFHPHRMAYLMKQVRAMETVCRKLAGETFSFANEVQYCFDIIPTRTPEEQFEQAWAYAEESLPGKGILSERLNTLRRRYLLAPERSHLATMLLQRALTEARRRAQTFLSFPANEQVHIEIVAEQTWSANNRYLGGYQSLIELNMDFPLNLRSLIEMACHEGYPGHHMEFLLKEDLLYERRGYAEHMIGLLIAPQALISEGLAMLAREMIFSLEEHHQWLCQYIYPAAGIEPLVTDGPAIYQVGPSWIAVRNNAAFLLGEGRSDEEVLQYVKRYLRLSDDRAAKELASLKRPFRETYAITYHARKQLLLPWLQGPDRWTVFRRFLSEQIIPSELIHAEPVS
jgi:hypothetical protein